MKYVIEKATRFPCLCCNYDNETPLQMSSFDMDFHFIPDRDKEQFEFRCIKCKNVITRFNMDFMDEDDINRIKENGLDIYNWRFSGLQVWAIGKEEVKI